MASPERAIYGAADRNFDGQTAMISDLLMFVVLAAFVASRVF